MSDYHLHLHPHEPTPYGPPPGEYPVSYLERYVEAAAARGVTELAFTEHLGRCVESAGLLGPFWEEETDPRLAEQTRAVVAAARAAGYTERAVFSTRRRTLVPLTAVGPGEAGD